MRLSRDYQRLLQRDSDYVRCGVRDTAHCGDNFVRTLQQAFGLGP
jgi:hypothetical protein